MAQAQAKHDASELLISHEGQPVAGQKHVEDEQTILDLDEEGGRKTAKMLKGQLMLQQCPPAPATTLHSGGAVEHKCWTASRHANRLWRWADSLSKLDCAPRVVDIVHSNDDATCLPATQTLPHRSTTLRVILLYPTLCHLALAHMSVFLAQQLLGFRLFEESAFWASMFCDGNERGFNLFAHVNWWAKSVPAIPFSQKLLRLQNW